MGGHVDWAVAVGQAELASHQRKTRRSRKRWRRRRKQPKTRSAKRRRRMIVEVIVDAEVTETETAIGAAIAIRIDKMTVATKSENYRGAATAVTTATRKSQGVSKWTNTRL